MSQSSEHGYAFSADSARRVSDAVRAVEATPAGARPGRQAAIPTSSHWFALVTTTITAGNLAGTPITLGKGLVTLLHKVVDGSGNATLVALSGTGNTGVTVYNGGASVASGRVIQVKPINGYLSVDVDYC